MSGPRFIACEAAGGRDWLLGHGPADGRQVLFLQPLFEEANRCRAVLAETQRRLAGAGVGSWLLDLPGTGDSARDIADVTWADWREAVAAAARTSGAVAVAAFRGGCLFDDLGLPRWRLAPLAGDAALRDLTRATGEAREPGWAPPEALRSALTAATVTGAARVVRLASDPAPADARLDGAPPWRRAEPAADAALAGVIAADIAGWLGA